MTPPPRCPTFPFMPSIVEHRFQPSKIIGIGQNYRAHAKEMGKGIPDEPLMFLKPPSALILDGAPIWRPEGYDRVDFEGELGVVIKEHTRRISREHALDAVLNYTNKNNKTKHKHQKKNNQKTHTKRNNTFCPI